MIEEHIASPSAGLKRLNCNRVKKDGIVYVYDKSGTLIFKNPSYYTLLAYCRILLPKSDPINKNGEFKIFSRFSLESAMHSVSKEFNIEIPAWLVEKMKNEG